MAAVFPDAVTDKELDYIATATIVFLLAAAETVYATAATNALASSVIDSSNFVKADDTSGRKLTFTGPTGVTPDADGTGAYLGFGISGSSTFLGTVPLSATVDVLTSGTVNFGTFKINVQDPT